MGKSTYCTETVRVSIDIYIRNANICDVVLASKKHSNYTIFLHTLLLLYNNVLIVHTAMR